MEFTKKLLISALYISTFTSIHSAEGVNLGRSIREANRPDWMTEYVMNEYNIAFAGLSEEERVAWLNKKKDEVLAKRPFDVELKRKLTDIKNRAGEYAWMELEDAQKIGSFLNVMRGAPAMFQQEDSSAPGHDLNFKPNLMFATPQRGLRFLNQKINQMKYELEKKYGEDWIDARIIEKIEKIRIEQEKNRRYIQMMEREHGPNWKEWLKNSRRESDQYILDRILRGD
jgi:hypothetical protein